MADGDLISRQDIDECKELMRATNGEMVYAVRMEDIRQLPSAAIPQAEKTCNIEESNFDMRQYKLDTDTAYECGYNAGLRVQKDGDLISRQALLDRLDDFNKWCKDGRLQGSLFAVDVIKDMPSVAMPQDHDGCKDCKYQDKSEDEMPCLECMHNYTDEWEREKPTDTITMTREEFSEKLMEHYRQGRADEKAYQNGEIMQSFNPD